MFADKMNAECNFFVSNFLIKTHGSLKSLKASDFLYNFIYQPDGICSGFVEKSAICQLTVVWPFVNCHTSLA